MYLIQKSPEDMVMQVHAAGKLRMRISLCVREEGGKKSVLKDYPAYLKSTKNTNIRNIFSSME